MTVLGHLCLQINDTDHGLAMDGNTINYATLTNS